MTVRECYEKIGSDFDKVLGRMGSEALVKRFAVKFLEDKSFEELTESLKEKDGEDAFRAAHPDAMLIALSGWGRDEDRQKSRDAGFNGHVVKPVAPDDIRRFLAMLA